MNRREQSSADRRAKRITRAVITVLGLGVAAYGAYRLFTPAAPVAERGPGAVTPAPPTPPVAVSPTGRSRADQQAYFSQVSIADVEEEIIAVTLRGRRFTVVVHKKRLVWPAEAEHQFDPDGDETATFFEVRDENGAVVFRPSERAPESSQRLRQEIDAQGMFVWTSAISAVVVEGTRGRALSISDVGSPCAPSSTCATHYLLGIFEGELRLFSDPFAYEIVMPEATGPATDSAGQRIWRLQTHSETGDDFFEVRWHTGSYWVIAPVRVDFLRVKLLPQSWCVRLGAPADEAEYCELAVEAHRRAASDETFVRLFPRADASLTPDHVVVRPQSTVEFLSVLAPPPIDRNGTWRVEPDIPLNFWLKVRVNGKTGWVRDAEDLMALGLSQTG